MNCKYRNGPMMAMVSAAVLVSISYPLTCVIAEGIAFRCEKTVVGRALQSAEKGLVEDSSSGACKSAGNINCVEHLFSSHVNVRGISTLGPKLVFEINNDGKIHIRHTVLLGMIDQQEAEAELTPKAESVSFPQLPPYPLHDAAMRGSVGLLRQLLDAGADVNQKDRSGRTPLHYALDGSQCLLSEKALQMLNMLIASGSDVNQGDQFGDTALHLVACKRGPQIPEVMNNLLKAGAAIEARDKAGDTPLHKAAIFRSSDSLKVLISLGADLNAENQSGLTPLICAITIVFTQSLRELNDDSMIAEAVKTLLGAGADVNARTKSGLTALGIALRRGKTEVAGLLKAHGAQE